MIEIKKSTLNDELLKDSIDYEDYSDNICTLTIEEMKAEGLLKCGGCCSKGKGAGGSASGVKNKCSGCRCKNK